MSEENKTEEGQLEELAEKSIEELEAMITGIEVPEEEEEQVEEAADEVEEELPKTDTDEEEPEEESEESEEKNSEEEDNRESAEETTSEEVQEQPRDNAAFAKMRHKLKEAERKLAEKEKQVAVSESVKDTVGKLVKVWESGEGNDKPMLAAMSDASSKELMDIYSEAAKGTYGEQSEDVVRMVQQKLPFAQAREAQKAEEVRQNREAVRKEYDEEVNQAKEDYKHFAEAESEGGKFYKNFLKSIAGELDDSGSHNGEGELPENLALYLHSHPYVAHQLADKVFKAQSSKANSSELTKAQKKISSLEKKLRKYEGVADPSPSKGTSAKSDFDMSQDELERKILGIN